MTKKVLPEILSKILEKLEIYVHPYDRKVFINGMSAILTQPDLSEIISLKALQIIDSIVTMLRVQQVTEMKERERKKNLDIESDSDDDHHRNLFVRGTGGKIGNQDFEEDEEENEDSDSDEFNDDNDENEDFDEEGIDFSKENEDVYF